MQQWWKYAIGYQIYPMSFCDKNNDGIGDIKGIISKLDYLEDLGVNLIWICPMYDSPMDDNGYDIRDYEAIYAPFGTMEDMQELIDKANAKGIKIMMDLVVNHTSDEHIWFQKALKDKHSPYRDYYWFKEGDGKGNPPCNWRSVFGGPVWEKVPGEDNMYYFHSFSKRQPDLNWNCPSMRRELGEMIARWMKRGIAGFRVDAINFINKDAFVSHEVDGPDGLVSCFAYTRNVPGIEKYYVYLKEIFDANKCVTICEATGMPYEELDVYVGEHGTFSMVFDFNYTNIDVENEDYFRRTNWRVESYRDLLYDSQLQLQKVGWSAPFLENHDQPRCINKLIRNEKYHAVGAKTLALMLLSLKGTPFIYQGQEIGMVNFKRTGIEQFDDLNAKSQYEQSLANGFSEEESIYFLNMRSRDNSRTPMCWDKSQYGGFSNHEPWILMNEKYPSINVEDQIKDETSVLNFYKKVIHLRKSDPAFVESDFEAYPLHKDIISYKRGKYTIYINLSDKDIKLDIEGNIVLNSYSDYDGTLKPYQGLITEQ
ncbi:MAG: alpha-glucosidase [Holdemanella sp.]|nr:alpha-glucosidase [Holdemanella sp.]MCF0124997.1 alpha-glucosidase [Clostridia bacterium]